jgi:hypothetical protein
MSAVWSKVMPKDSLTSEQLQVFLACTRRFDDIVQKLPVRLRYPDSRVHVKHQDWVKDFSNEDAVHSVIRYFNLCAEEFFLHEKGLILGEVWDLWSKQILMMFQDPFILAMWKGHSSEGMEPRIGVSNHYKDHKGFFEFIDKNLPK